MWKYEKFNLKIPKEISFCCCLATSSLQWYQWNTAQPHARLCAECWTYYKKLGGLKYPKKSGKKFLLRIRQNKFHLFYIQF